MEHTERSSLEITQKREKKAMLSLEPSKSQATVKLPAGWNLSSYQQHGQQKNHSAEPNPNDSFFEETKLSGIYVTIEN